MPKIQTRCPNCQQPLVADVQQVLDVGVDPSIKDKLLSGSLNIAQCPSCGFQGQLPLPIVYHDPEKEMLLTFYPPSMNKTMEEKESEIGPLLKQVTENLPQEARKGYLFQPKAMMTMQSMVKAVLEAEGITQEMIEQQQEKMDLLEKLLQAEGEAQVEIIKEHKDKIDREFFAIFSQIVQRMLSSQNQEVLQKVQELQDNLLEETEVGQEIARESAEIEAARKTLEDLGSSLTREKLVDLVVEAPGEGRVRALVSLARPAMDYQFMQLLTERLEEAEGEEREQMVKRRNLILQLTKEIDEYLEKKMGESRATLEKILESESVEEGVIQQASRIDETFLQVLTAEMEQAEQEGNQPRLEKLQSILQIIQQISTPREYQLIDDLLEAADDEGRVEEILDENEGQINQELIGYLTNLISSLEQNIQNLTGEEKNQQEDILDRVTKVHRLVLKRSMKKSFQG